MKSKPTLQDKLLTLFHRQRLAVLATQHRDGPYTNLVAFACSEDLRRLVFATPKATRKFANLTAHPGVSLFIDNRSNKAIDFRKALGVTAVGSVRQIRKTRSSKLVQNYLRKNPQLESFIGSPSCALLCIDIKTYYVVERFQNVTEIHLK